MSSTPTKHCHKCAQDLPATRDFFYPAKSRRDGWRPYCKACEKRAALDRIARQSEIRRAPTRRCSGCGQTLPATEEYFNRNRSRPDGLQALCRTCGHEASNRSYRKKNPLAATKVCTRCHQELPATTEYFNQNRRTIDGLHYRCVACKRAEKQLHDDWRERQRNARRDLRLTALQQYSPGGVPTCACCGEQRIEFLVLDHIEGGGNEERKTTPVDALLRKLRDAGWPQGKHRVLCHNCNSALGYYGYCPHRPDDPAFRYAGARAMRAKQRRLLDQEGLVPLPMLVEASA